MLDGIICNCNGKDKVVDFRDGLVLANEDDYAELQGKGGRDHARNSVIKIYLCDFTNGTGSNSTTVHANITPDIADEIYNVCQQNLGTVVLPVNDVKAVQMAFSQMGKVFNAVFTLIFGMMNIAARKIKNEIKGSVTKEIGVLAKETMAIVNKEAPEQSASVTFNRNINYSLTQDKVNIYYKDADGFAPVSRLMIYRSGIRKNGDFSTYPWVIKITNGIAKVVEKDTGATTFDSNTLRNKEESYIQLSDRDMYRCMYRVNRFIEMWECSFCVSLIRKGEAKHEMERQKYLAQQQEREEGNK